MKVSIITVTLNSLDTIASTIDSVLIQNYQNIEYIIVDGKSTDGTIDKIKQYGTKINQLVSEQDNGIYDALNKGILISTGDLIGIMHSGDTYPNSKVITKVVTFFNKSKNSFLYGDINYIKTSSNTKLIRKWISNPYSKNSLSRGWTPPHTSLFCKRSVYQSVGLYALEYTIASDYDMWLKLFLKHGDDSIYLNETLCTMSLGGASNKTNNILTKWKEDYQILKRNSVGGVFTLIFKNLRKIRQYF